MHELIINDMYLKWDSNVIIVVITIITVCYQIVRNSKMVNSQNWWGCKETHYSCGACEGKLVPSFFFSFFFSFFLGNVSQKFSKHPYPLKQQFHIKNLIWKKS